MTGTVSAGAGRYPALAAPLACGCCLLAGAAYVAAVDPAQGRVFAPCPFRTLTGWWCPGCGLTRATHHLLRGDLGQALRYNVFVIAVVAAVSIGWVTWTLRTAGRPPRRALSVPTWVSTVAIAALVLFAIVRNLPGVHGLRG